MSESKAPYNAGIIVELMRAELPSDLEKHIAQVMRDHVGRAKAISRPDLLRRLRAWPHNLDVVDRQVRLAIGNMRKAEVPICSTGGINGGYWLSESRQELHEYLDNEVRSRLADLREQELALMRAERKYFGDQLGLGI